MFVSEDDLEKYKDEKINLMECMCECVSKKPNAETGIPKICIFLSHKHDELKILERVISFFRKKCDADVYIDSEDQKMPSFTCKTTASRIKKKIEDCDKFILIATKGAIESKWCNWELGYGDGKKENSDIALFPIEQKDYVFSGQEYLQIYDHIERDEQGDEFFVVKKGTSKRIPLENWLIGAYGT